MKALLPAFLVVALSFGFLSSACAQSEITLLSPNPIQASFTDKLVAGFEAKTGIQVKVTYGSGLSTRKQVASGQALDVSVLFAPFPEAVATGNVVPTSATVIAEAFGNSREERCFQAGHLHARSSQADAAECQVDRRRGPGSGQRRGRYRCYAR